MMEAQILGNFDRLKKILSRLKTVNCKQFSLVPITLTLVSSALVALSAVLVKFQAKADLYFLLLFRFVSVFLILMLIVTANSKLRREFFKFEHINLLIIRGIGGVGLIFGSFYGFAHLPLGLSKCFDKNF